MDPLEKPVAKSSIPTPTTRHDPVADDRIDDDDDDVLDEDDEFGDAAIEAAKTSAASASDAKRPATQSTAHLDSDDEDLFREIDSFL